MPTSLHADAPPMSLPHKLLIAEDDRKTAELLDCFLTKEGFRTFVARDGRQALELFALQQPDLVILDVMLPLIDGFDVCALIRRSSQVPILFLTARDEETDIVLGLGLGADDYVAKPFSPRELVARIKTLFRRTIPALRGNDDAPSSIAGLAFVPTKRCFMLRGELLQLTPIEFTLLLTLMRSPGRVFQRSELLATIYPTGDPVIERVVDVHIGKIRQKLGDDPTRTVYIHTVRGVGYRFTDAEPA